jgi:hypothetical protein
MLQLSPFIAQTRLFSSAECHLSAFDPPSVDYPPRHLSAPTRDAHVTQYFPKPSRRRRGQMVILIHFR